MLPFFPKKNLMELYKKIRIGKDGEIDIPVFLRFSALDEGEP